MRKKTHNIQKGIIHTFPYTNIRVLVHLHTVWTNEYGHCDQNVCLETLQCKTSSFMHIHKWTVFEQHKSMKNSIWINRSIYSFNRCISALFWWRLAQNLTLSCKCFELKFMLIDSQLFSAVFLLPLKCMSIYKCYISISIQIISIYEYTSDVASN